MNFKLCKVVCLLLIATILFSAVQVSQAQADFSPLVLVIVPVGEFNSKQWKALKLFCLDFLPSFFKKYYNLDLKVKLENPVLKDYRLSFQELEDIKISHASKGDLVLVVSEHKVPLEIYQQYPEGILGFIWWEGKLGYAQINILGLKPGPTTSPKSLIKFGYQTIAHEVAHALCFHYQTKVANPHSLNFTLNYLEYASQWLEKVIKIKITLDLQIQENFIETTIFNQGEFEVEFLWILQVKDKMGRVVNLNYIKGVILPQSDLKFKFPISKFGVEYEIFIWESWERPIPLTESKEIIIGVE